MGTLGFSLHEINRTPDIITWVERASFVLFGSISRTYQHVFARINLNEKLWEELPKPSFFTCFDLCIGCCKWWHNICASNWYLYTVSTSSHLSYLKFVVCNLSCYIYSLFNYQNCNKFVIFSVQTLKRLSPQPRCAFTYIKSHSVTQLYQYVSYKPHQYVHIEAGTGTRPFSVK
jgi:hypothetical protein